MAQNDVYLIAARRTALGRVGGLHARRRIEALTGPVITSALADCRINPAIVDGLIVGNTTEPSNPARLIALSAGLPGRTDAMTVDKQCASGLDAIILAARAIAGGDSEVMIAGGAEALSTAPWRIARPKHLHQTPRFLGYEPVTADEGDEPHVFEASERLAMEHHFPRAALDDVAMASHAAALSARAEKRFVSEIVPLRQAIEETRDELVRDLEPCELSQLPPYTDDGVLTSGNTSAPADGAAFIVMVNERIWTDLGQPVALRYVASASLGVGPNEEASAAIAVVEKLLALRSDLDLAKLASIETSEASTAQILAFCRRFEIAPPTVTSASRSVVNSCGGAIARGHPFGASGAVLMVRLFSNLIRHAPVTPKARGLAVLSAIGGLATAAVFEVA